MDIALDFVFGFVASFCTSVSSDMFQGLLQDHCCLLISKKVVKMLTNVVNVCHIDIGC